jgi:molybdopterin synthase catalytic subunit
VYLTDEIIDPSALMAEVMAPSCGALALFGGVVRDHHAGKAVQSIYYDAYRPMAEKEIGRIVDQVRSAHAGVRVAVKHRLGLLQVGETSIVIACASPHRAEAYAASRALIDEIKSRVPIWKKERSPDGEEWLGWQE